MIEEKDNKYNVVSCSVQQPLRKGMKINILKNEIFNMVVFGSIDTLGVMYKIDEEPIKDLRDDYATNERTTKQIIKELQNGHAMLSA